jgi:transposase
VRYEEMVHTMKSEQEPGKAGRRHHDRSFKAELVRQSLEPGASVSAIALHNGVNANMLFKWRRDHLRAQSQPTTDPAVRAVLLPVELVRSSPEVATTQTSADVAPSASKPAPRNGVIELEIGGVQMRLRGAVDESSLCSVLRALRQAR